MDISVELEELKQEIIGSCKKCSGVGYIEGNPCDCMVEFRVWNRLYPNGFGKDYLRHNFSDIIEKINFKEQKDRNIIDWYVNNFKKVYKNGLCLYIFGERYGIGKTTLAVSVVKEYAKWALFSERYIWDFKGRYLDVSEVLKWNELQNESDDIRVVVIDEFGKRVMENKEEEAMKIEKFIRNKVKEERSVILVGNVLPRDIPIKYSDSLAEFLGVRENELESNIFRSVHVIGESFRTMRIETKWR